MLRLMKIRHPGRSGVSLLLSFLILVTLASSLILASGCDTRQGGDITTAPGDATTGAANSDWTGIDVQSVTIIRPDNASDAVMNMASEVFAALRDAAGVSPSISTDWLIPGKTYDPDAYEILIGDNACPESIAATEALADNEFSLTVSGRKLVIVCGKSDEFILSGAVARFIELLPSLVSDGKITLSGAFPIKVACTVALTADRMLYKLPVGGNFTTVDTRSEQKVYGQCTVELYDDYITQLKDAGNSVIAENVIGKNRFCTLEDASHKLLTNVTYLDGKKAIRVITEPWYQTVASLPSPAGAGECPVTLLQLECTTGSMAAYVLRLQDGRFVLFDTGTEAEGPMLIKYMRENNIFKDGKIHIAAIYITHPHVDHTGGLASFVASYSGELVVESVWANLIAGTIQDVYSQSSLESRFSEIYSAAKTFGATFMYARAGQKLTLPGTAIEIMFTPDELGDYRLDNTDTSHDMNNACLIIRLTSAGQTIIFTGDARGGEAPLVADMYVADMKCDIMTVTHHCYNIAAAVRLYTYARPQVLLWPNNYYDTSRSFVNQLLSAIYVKEHLLADKRHVLTLPYTPQ